MEDKAKSWGVPRGQMPSLEKPLRAQVTIREDPGSARGQGLGDSCWELRKNIPQLGTTGIQGLQRSHQGTTLPGVPSLCQGLRSLCPATGRKNTGHSLGFAFLRGMREGVGALAPARCHRGPPPCHTPRTCTGGE